MVLLRQVVSHGWFHCTLLNSVPVLTVHRLYEVFGLFQNDDPQVESVLTFTNDVVGGK